MACNAATPVMNTQDWHIGGGINQHESTPTDRLDDICIHTRLLYSLTRCYFGKICPRSPCISAVRSISQHKRFISSYPGYIQLPKTQHLLLCRHSVQWDTFGKKTTNSSLHCVSPGLQQCSASNVLFIFRKLLSFCVICGLSHPL